MAYANKYKITVATKSDSISYVYLQEDGYAGALIEYPGVSLQLQYIPRSDDIFEAIYVSQLNCVIDVTDDIANMPDFTTLNDRKYLIKLYNGETLEWQGWALSNDVQMTFSTGRRNLSFSGIDGLGILEKIPYPFSTENTLVNTYKALSFILNSLNVIAFPTNLNFISGISFFANTMTNRTTSLAAEPLNQTYINAATFINDNKEVKSTLQVIIDIATAFSCRLFQSEGKWFMVPLTEFAQDSYYFTEYNGTTGAVVTSGTRTLSSTIQGYTGNTSGSYFVDNNQIKLIKKGYNKIRFNKTIEYPSNYITNWDLKQFTYVSPTENNAYGWTSTRNGGIIYVKEYSYQQYNSFIMLCSSISPYWVSVKPNALPKLGLNETTNIKFDIVALGAGISGPGALFVLKVQVTNGTDTYFLNFENKWLLNTYPLHYYYEPFDGSNPRANVDITTPPCPITGDLTIELLLDDSVFATWQSTVSSVEVQNFSLQVVPAFYSVLTESYINNTKEYVLELDLAMGFNNSNDGFFSYRGFLSDSTGYTLKNWYRMEYMGDVYRSLSELVIKQYSNCLNKNVINIDGSFMGMNTTNGRLSGAMRLKADDTDPIQLSVQDKKYILGNSTIDLPNNVISATLLDINDGNISTTLNTVYNTNNLDTTSASVAYGHYRSNGYLTREEAYAAPLTLTKIWLNGPGVPSLGTVYYVNDLLLTPFNGAALWWKVLTTDTSFRAFKISSSGVVLEIYG